jgi:hypothetical protein
MSSSWFEVWSLPFLTKNFIWYAFTF